MRKLFKVLANIDSKLAKLKPIRTFFKFYWAEFIFGLICAAIIFLTLKTTFGPQA